MDADGARHLEARLAQQAHWELAAAVREGSQPRLDPDADALIELADGLRVYTLESSLPVASGHPPRNAVLVKRLVDGWWRAELLDAADPPLRRSA